MAYNRAEHLKELQGTLSYLLLSIETDEKEIRRPQNQERDAVERNVEQEKA